MNSGHRRSETQERDTCEVTPEALPFSSGLRMSGESSSLLLSTVDIMDSFVFLMLE